DGERGPFDLIAEAAVCSQLAGDTESVNAKSQIDRLAPDRQVLELLVFHDPAPFLPAATFGRPPGDTFSSSTPPATTINHSSFPVCHPPLAICHPPLAICHPPLAICICHLPSCHLPSAICDLPSCHPPFTTTQFPTQLPTNCAYSVLALAMSLVPLMIARPSGKTVNS